MTNLSEHFTLEEFTYSDTAKAYGIKNTPTLVHLNTMKHTCVYLLEPLRTLLTKKFGTTVYLKITSGYRGAALNAKVGGSSTSQHCKGEAADIEAYYKKDGKKVVIPFTTTYELIKGWVKTGELSVDQCIQEQSGTAKWVHVSHSAAGRIKDRKQFLKYNGKSYLTDIIIK